MKYIVRYDFEKGWHIAKMIEEKDDVLILPLTENDVIEIVTKLNSIVCQG